MRPNTNHNLRLNLFQIPQLTIYHLIALEMHRTARLRGKSTKTSENMPKICIPGCGNIVWYRQWDLFSPIWWQIWTTMRGFNSNLLVVPLPQTSLILQITHQADLVSDTQFIAIVVVIFIDNVFLPKLVLVLCSYWRG